MTPFRGLVLSLFPGIGAFDRGFEERGFVVVRGPDLIYGGRVEDFEPPSGCFDGVIGGPPCQRFGGLARHGYEFPDLVPEFARCVELAAPTWYVMENAPNAPLPETPSFEVVDRLVDNHWLDQEQQRRRRFTFGLRSELGVAPWFHVPTPALHGIEKAPTLTAAHSGARPAGTSRHRDGWEGKPVAELPIARCLELQGLPADHLPVELFKARGARKVIAQAVPLPMARAVAAAVLGALDAARVFAPTGETT